MKTVIIGGVAGGATCAARLRRLDESAEIVVFERGEYISYANCGLPYHVSGVIRERSSLLLGTPASMRTKYNVDVRVKNEVVAINRDRKTVTVKRTDTGETYDEKYDKLVISTGSSPMRPPIPGINSHRVMTLWTVPDVDKIKKFISDTGAKRAVVVGGGFIGLESAENLRDAGLEVTVVELAEQVMPPFDYEMAQLIREHLLENGVTLRLGEGVTEFNDTDNGLAVKLSTGDVLNAEFAILAVGVRPNGELAKSSRLNVNKRGGIVTDTHMRTNDPDIYAVGDVAEITDFIFSDRTMIPLAGPANKQGRIAADNIAGLDSVYRGAQGSSVVKIFDLTAASTGASEKTLIKRGMAKGKDYETVTITQNSHAGYYPGATPLTLKLIFSADGSKIFGAQIVGRDGVDKRVDTIATVIRLNGSVYDLQELELAYAPPYSSAKDPVNMAGYVAGNLLRGDLKFTEWDVVEKNTGAQLLDVREAAEIAAFAIPGTIHIPLGKLRERLDELDKSRPVVVFCAIGVRAYNAARILMQNGFTDVAVYPGGSRFYRSTHCGTPNDSKPPDGRGNPERGAAPANPPQNNNPNPAISIKLDCSGMQCPGPIMKVFESIKAMREGELLEVSASDPGFMRDIEAWCRRTGNTLISREARGAEYVAMLRKGEPDEDNISDGGVPTSTKPEHSVKTAPASPSALQPDGKTIIVFSGDLDRVLAGFIIANGAAAMGRPVTMFFTFWGLTALRKPEKVKVKKGFMEKMFGAMLPRGTGKLGLSRMNMGGMGTAMMKKIMHDKNVDSLEDLIKKALANGVKLIACTMSMDIMGIKPEELIDGVEFAGVGSYLGDAEESNVNLFI